MTIVRNGVRKLDWTYFLEQPEPLVAMKEEPESLTPLAALRQLYLAESEK